jgi:hypothetical protein
MRSRAVFLSLSQPLNETRQYIISDVIDELSHRVNPLAARGAGWDSLAVTAFDDHGRFVYEYIKAVSANLGL